MIKGIHFYISFIPKGSRIYKCKFRNNVNARSEVKTISKNKVIFLFPSLLNESNHSYYSFSIYAVSSALILSIYFKHITYHYTALGRKKEKPTQ